ncbi:ABC transporter substrate-binding protein [Ktedonosporobacter rubrisoli]|uniref:ABC transporter substrate-binding protein n=1 Tax=Ktedonosporobacter rubrisoli TaxID=2509675 RepID=A0A4P6JZ72_KTERU|nr:ABC transporter substrate-binding protein [Ktedonosporobacter rubrisoli]QBD81024.1 ABC transporter substrate-binding protein [Ktedonosporobacter rubrisoli]
MFPEQREALDEIIVKMRSGRMKRRTFLERALAVGLTSGAAVSLLEACGGTTNSTGGNGAATNIVWQSENDTTNTYKDLVDTFNSTIGKQKGIHVTWNQGPSSTDEMLAKYTTMLRARSHSIDVLSLDIVYPAEFGAQQWIAPISDSQWPTSERSKYLPGPVQGCTYQGKLWAAPYRTDLGLLYYRKDLVPTPPATWDDLTSTAKSVSPSKIKYGYVWQGSQYEGLVCNFVEVLYGMGGHVLDPNDPTKVTVNSPEGQKALSMMVGWVGTISPDAVTTYTEDPSRSVFQNGNSAFMRNWPYAYALGSDSSQSKIAGKFDISALPHGGSESVGHSAIGGWNLAINAFTPNADQCWEFIKYMLQPAAQKEGATKATWTTTLQSVYDDQEVLSKAPLFGKLKPILQNALPRPVSPKYPDLSKAIQLHIYQALKKQASPNDALSALQADLQKLVASS